MLPGDFNEILKHGEKFGGRVRPEWQLENFKETLVACNLRDLGFQASPFTSSNQREGIRLICERLDRCVTNWGWSKQFSRGMVTHDSVAYSDHVSLLLQTDGASLVVSRSQKLLDLRRYG